MSRGYTAEFVKSLHEGVSVSVVQLSAVDKKAKKVAHLGTGVIVCSDSGYIGIITAISCDPEKYRVGARFAGGNYLEAQVIRTGSVLSGLVIHGYDGVVDPVPVTSDSFEENPEISEPVWTGGCFSENLDESMPGGNICICNISKRVRKKDLVQSVRLVSVQTFVHSCPIGDGLIGAPVVNRFGKILGITIARSVDTSNVNFGMRFEELKGGLAELADGANSEESMSSILGKLTQTMLQKLPKKTKRSDAGSSSKKARKA